MSICHNNLWKILVDERMSKMDLIRAYKVTTNAMAKLEETKMYGRRS